MRDASTIQLHAVDPVVVPKASSILADRLREQILSSTSVEGLRLPSERELTESTGLSRASVREALRILEADGLIETRRGRNGGAWVRQPDGAEITKAINVFVSGARVSLRALLEAREAIEPAAAALAAERRAEEDLQAMADWHRRLEAANGDNERFLEANIGWHLAVVRASGNQLFVAFMGALSEAIFDATDIEVFDTDAIRNDTLVAHTRVMRAIRAGDVAGARRYMGGHVRATSTLTTEFDLALEGRGK